MVGGGHGGGGLSREREIERETERAVAPPWVSRVHCGPVIDGGTGCNY